MPGVSEIQCIVRTSLPVRGKRMELYAFDYSIQDCDEPEVVALVNGYRRTNEESAIVRIHSTCFTGDILGSEKCDCGPQLEYALDAIARAPWGILIYLAQQEGRGIGLVRKLQTYVLQDEGFDTATANEELHAPIDGRDYVIAVEALRYLQVKRLWLLSNSPDKISVLRSRGIRIEGVQRLPVRISQFNAAYIESKQARFGHDFVGGASDKIWSDTWTSMND